MFLGVIKMTSFELKAIRFYFLDGETDSPKEKFYFPLSKRKRKITDATVHYTTSTMRRYTNKKNPDFLILAQFHGCAK